MGPGGAALSIDQPSIHRPPGSARDVAEPIRAVVENVLSGCIDITNVSRGAPQVGVGPCGLHAQHDLIELDVVSAAGAEHPAARVGRAEMFVGYERGAVGSGPMIELFPNATAVYAAVEAT